MRNPDRIDRILELISIFWHKNPDLRLGQLLMIAGGFSKDDNFALEDDIVEEHLIQWIKD